MKSLKTNLKYMLMLLGIILILIINIRNLNVDAILSSIISLLLLMVCYLQKLIINKLENEI
jgi:hypothetical protein